MNEQEFQEKLAVERREIDRIDRELLPLFLERMGCVERVGELKRSKNRGRSSLSMRSISRRSTASFS